MSRTNALTLCCRIMLTALCVTCSFPPAWAATDVAAKTARVPHGPETICIHGGIAGAFLPRPPEDARAALPTLAPACVLRGKRRSRTPCPPPCRMTMRRGALHGSLRSRLRRTGAVSLPRCGGAGKFKRAFFLLWRICAIFFQRHVKNNIIARTDGKAFPMLPTTAFPVPVGHFATGRPTASLLRGREIARPFARPALSARCFMAKPRRTGNPTLRLEEPP